jgi:hypothetical protein
MANYSRITKRIPYNPGFETSPRPPRWPLGIVTEDNSLVARFIFIFQAYFNALEMLRRGLFELKF